LFHNKALVRDEVIDKDGGFECYECGDLKQAFAGEGEGELAKEVGVLEY